MTSVTQCDLDVEACSVLTVQCGWCISVAVCAEPTCSIVLAWQNAMEDGDAAFRAKSCTCGDECLFHTLCCSDHKDTFVCPDCDDKSGEFDIEATEESAAETSKSSSDETTEQSDETSEQADSVRDDETDDPETADASSSTPAAKKSKRSKT